MAGRTGRLICVVAAAIALAGCWTQVDGGPGRTGSNPYDTAWTTANAGQAVVKWKTDTTIRASAVSANGMIAASTGQQLRVWSTTPASCSGTVPTCAPQWVSAGSFAGMTQPALSNNRVFTLAEPTNSNRTQLQAYSFDGVTGCSAGTPATCAPLWTADLGTGVNAQSAMTVGSRVLVHIAPSGGLERIAVFDVGGSLGCDTTAHTCSPLAVLTNPSNFGGFGDFVSDGSRVFAPTFGAVVVFDLGLSAGCSGNGLCSPIAQFPISSPDRPSVAGGRLYVVQRFPDYALDAFDATLATHCAPGSLPTCTPLWHADLPSSTSQAPVVAGGHVQLVTNRTGTGTGMGVDVFDAAGVQGCDATTATCTALWRDTIGTSEVFGTTLAANANLLLMATFDRANPGAPTSDHLFSFDLTGAVNCSGIPKTCAPVGALELQNPATTIVGGNPMSVASGLVTVPLNTQALPVVGLP